MFPLGIWCLSAVRMAWVRMVLEMCGLSCGCEFEERIFFNFRREFWPVGFIVVGEGSFVRLVPVIGFCVQGDWDWEMV